MQDEHGNTALHAASGKGHIEVMTGLIKSGANVNSLNKVCISIFPQYRVTLFSAVFYDSINFF